MEETRLNLLACPSPRRLLACVFALPENEKLRVICLLWLWWTERNKANHNQTRATVQDFCFLLTKNISEWKEFCATPVKGSMHERPSWAKPAVDLVKVNIDGAFDQTSQQAGWGCVARDHTGDVLFAAAGSLANISEPLHAEVAGLLNAITLAENHGMGRVIFETDCSGLQQAVTTTTLDRSSLGTLFREIKYRLHLAFIDWSVVFCPRTCNVPAHELAALGTSGVYGDQHVWLGNLPNIVTVAVTADLVGPR